MTKHWWKFILIGLTLILISLLTIRFDYKKLIDSFNDDSDYTKKTYTSNIEDLNNLKIDANNTTIEIIPVDKEEIKITYYESKYNKFNINKTNNTLEMIETTKFKMISITFTMFEKTIVLEIPKDLILNMDVKTSNSKISIRDLETNMLKLKSNNDKIIVNNVKSNNVNLISSNDRIELRNINANYINAKTSNSKIAAYNLSANTTLLKTSNAPIEMENIKSPKKIDAITSNDKITFDRISSNNIYFKTSNDSITGIIRDDELKFNCDFKTSNSNIIIDNQEYSSKYKRDNNAPNNLTLHTSNDYIKINYIK